MCAQVLGYTREDVHSLANASAVYFLEASEDVSWVSGGELLPFPFNYVSKQYAQ